MSDLRDTMGPEAQKVLDGLLRKRLYVAFIRPVRPLDDELSAQITALLPQHFTWLLEQEREGRVFAAGPFIGDDGESYPGDGMFILQAGSLEEARALTAQDPINAAGLRTADVRAWELNEGGFTVTVRYSDGGFSLR